MEWRTKPPSFAPMPRLPLSIQPQNPQVVLWRWDEGSAWSLAKLEVHFPEREWAEVSGRRLQEHQAVACALTELMGSEGWRVTHLNGKPLLHNVAGTKLPLSISHHSSERSTTAAVAVWEAGEKHHGIDLVDTEDLRISRIAARFMSPGEQTRWSKAKPWVWAAKEAMFKGHGPNLDFRHELSVDSMDREADCQRLVGSVRGAPWRGECARVPQSSLGVVWSSPSVEDFG